MKKGDLDNLDLCSFIVTGAIHDFEHPGVNNMFLINTKDELAIRYNDMSVLENHHVAAAFNLFKDKNLDFLSNFEVNDFKELRKRIVSMVLATDMSKHFSDLGRLKQRINSNDFAPDSDDKLLTMTMGIHMADISNPTKNWKLTLVWTEMLFEEFFDQGD